MRHPHRYNRRDFLKAVGIMGAGSLLAACGPTGAPPAPEAAPEAADSMAAGEKYDGVTLRMLTQAGGDYEPAFRAWAEDFTAETGAQVEFEFAPWESLMPKVQADLASGSPQFDLFCNDIEFQYTIWPELEPINDFLDASGYDMEGFFDPVYRYGEGIAGNTGVRYGLPVTCGVSVLFNRTDLIDAFPTTWSDYDALLAAHTNDSMYGLSFAGVPAQLVKLFLARFWASGDPLLTSDWQPLINGESGVAALTLLKEHGDKYAPPGLLAWDNPMRPTFLAGVCGQRRLGRVICLRWRRKVRLWATGQLPRTRKAAPAIRTANIVMMDSGQRAAFELMAASAPQRARKEHSTLETPAARMVQRPGCDGGSLHVGLRQGIGGAPFTGVPQWLRCSSVWRKERRRPCRNRPHPRKPWIRSRKAGWNCWHRTRLTSSTRNRDWQQTARSVIHIPIGLLHNRGPVLHRPAQPLSVRFAGGQAPPA